MTTSRPSARDFRAWGRRHQASGDLGRALACFRNALTLDEAVPDSADAAVDLNSLGLVYRAQGDLEQARAHFLRAFTIAESIAPRSDEMAMTLNNLGLLCQEEGDLELALDFYERALEIDEDIAPRSGQVALDLNNIGSIYQAQGDLAGALDRYRRALAIEQWRAPRSLIAAKCLNNIGVVQQTQGDVEGALEHYRRAIEVQQAVAPRSQEMATYLNNVGFAHHSRGEYDHALDFYGRALEIAEAIAPRSAETAWALTHIGLVHRARGDLERALAHHRRALEIDEGIAPRSLATAGDLTNIGVVYEEQGDLDRAVAHYRRALEIDEGAAPLSDATATDLNNIGGIHLARGDVEQALEYYGRALEILEAIAPRSLETAARLNNVGFTLQAQGELDRARDCYRRALEITEAVAPRSKRAAICLNNLGGLDQVTGDLVGALGYFRRALAIDEAVAPDSNETAIRLTNIGSVHQARGDLAEAIESFEGAVAIAESLRTRAGGVRAREQVFAAHLSPYEGLVACLYDRGGEGDRERAFDYAERSRARGLVELLAERELEIEPRTEEQARLLTEERRLRFRLADAYNGLTLARQDAATAPERLAQLTAEEERLQEELATVVDRIRDPERGFAAYAEVRYPQPLALAQVQSGLEPSTLLLEYTLTTEDSFLFAVRSRAFSVHRLGASDRQFERLCEAAVGAYRRGQPAGAKAMQARAELSRLLLDVIPEKLTEGASRLLVVPDGPLFYLPFELLPLKDDELVNERYVTAYAPSATVLASLHGPRSGTGFVGFCDPEFSAVDDDEDENEDEARRRFRTGGAALAPLPGTRREVERIAALFGEAADTHVGAQATEHRAKTATAGYRFCHFATHGLLDDANPLYSGLALAPPAPGEPPEADDLLQVYELFALPLSDCELVVLSACQTGLGTIQAGEGLVGMTRALFFAGARSVVVSLWPVPDLPTARLMERFYRFLADSCAPADALRQAKQSVRRSHPEVYRDPHTWAGFVAVGLA